MEMEKPGDRAPPTRRNTAPTNSPNMAAKDLMRTFCYPEKRSEPKDLPLCHPERAKRVEGSPPSVILSEQSESKDL